MPPKSAYVASGTAVESVQKSMQKEKNLYRKVEVRIEVWFDEIRRETSFRLFLEHSCYTAERALLPKLVSAKSVLHHSARHSFYVGKEFRIRSCSLNQEWNVVSLHFEVERIAWTHRTNSTRCSQRR